MRQLRRLLPAPFAFALIAGSALWLWVHTTPPAAAARLATPALARLTTI